MKLTELIMAAKPSTSSLSPPPSPPPPQPSPPSPSSQLPSSHHRSVLAIDLNQVPETLPSPSSSSSSRSYVLLSPTTLVRSFHENPAPPEGAPAEIPVGGCFCGGCGRPSSESTSDRLVCDACERVFHFSCAGVFPGLLEEDWLCRFCVADGGSSKRWRLGRKEERGVRFIDMNASPPSDGDTEGLGTADVAARNLCSGNSSVSGYASGGLRSYPNLIYSSNGFGFQKASTIVAHTVRLDVQDILHNKRSTSRSIEDIQYGSQLGRIRSSGTTFRLPSWNSSEVLQSLRDFVSERHGILGEGWRVEFKQSKNGFESYAVYCAPDGRMFETMSDVANFLGLASNGNSLQPESRSDYDSTLRKNGLHQPKRRKLTKIPVGNGFMENNKDNVVSGYNGFFPNLQKEQLLSKSEKVVEATETLQEEIGVNDFHHFHEGLPLQYEDFFVLSLGKVDARTSYHDALQIWPVGYRSCWHDKVTGSLFLCHVLDGGDTGPVFKVRRVSCSELPVPYGSTFLQRQSGICLNDPNKESGEQSIPLEEELCIETLLSEPCFPPEDSLSWLLSGSNEADGQNIIHLSHEVHSTSERSQDLLAHSLSTGEKNGEFSVDGNSSSLVWSILSQKLVDTCRQIYKEKGSLKFFCKHVKDGMSSFYDIMTYKNRDVFSSLDRFCSLLGSLKVPSVVKSDDELDSTLEALRKWFSLDRFGLDVGFVQELIEQSPDVHRCPEYESVQRRNDCLTAPLVQNGLLLINGKSMEQHSTEFNGLYKVYRRIEDPDCSNHSRPVGKPLGAKLPPRLIGDVFQVWELLRRFHEILGLEPLNFDELEDELISPWFENSSLYGSCEKESPCGQAESADGSTSSENVRPDETRFIEMQSSSMRGEAHATQISYSDSKCNGLSLKRAHISLLDVLISELQIKVAAMVDPSIDAESKSRRGRRKDVDTSILAIRPKLNLLPINELTWPELARRYILAVLSMDGNLDSTETGIRECGKVLRCLQGDGGVLCGSLVGVEGIEADALLLAEAKKQIYGCLSSDNGHLTIEEDDPEPVGTSGRTGSDDGNIPEWAQVLEPVRKLPTNVGTRIRKCVYEALAKDPPDWAKKILERSISKEVYKGNASGPTKKAVLSVLADVVSEGMQQKAPKERKKKKTIVSISDTIMKKCRILLRRAASADEEKVFCNLVGRNLIPSSENDDEGLLGSPGMVSRPLDFRTIDLRLACGAYSGSHEAFLEDVRELWNNIRAAHTEQPELVQVAERLSENFELLYEEEVVALADKLKEYSEMKQISGEAKNEIKEVLNSTSDIPKAPWDEGVCKVCGIDKDDDSVLLCDTCDAEYHTYCLNPPLARIPEGNWYCPACVSGVSVLERTSKGVKFVGQRHRRKNHGEGIRNYLEELARLASVIEQKEYWEFCVDEKILLLKFLSDEVLNSIVIRQHLEQCFETSADLHQKLRMLYSEWKNIKLREDILATTVPKSSTNVPVVAGDTSIEGNIDTMTNNTVGTELKHENDGIPSNSDTTRPKSEMGILLSSNQRKEKLNANYSRVKQPVDSELPMKDLSVAVNDNNTPPDNKDLHERSYKRRKNSSLQDCSVLNTVRPETSGMDYESFCQERFEDPQGVGVSLEETVACSTSNVNDAKQNELSVLQQSIVNAESQLLKSSVRLEFLGSDSSGRLYWASALPGSHPRVIVDGTIALQTRKESSSLRLQGSSAGCPFVYGQDHSDSTCPQWVYYQSEDEIKELVESLKLNNPKERELKDSILNWKKLRFHGLHQTASQDKIPSSVSTSVEESEAPGALVTRADTLLEGRYGPFCQVERLEDVKKRLRRSKGSNDEKLYRCRCLEPIWFSRHHCLVCHKTFYTSSQLDKHNGGKCKSNSTTTGKRKDSNEPVGDKVSRKSEAQPHLAKVKDRVQASKNVDSDLSRHVKFQNEGSRCPHKFEEISSKFVTNDSIKELVHGIGLIGSDGMPSFVSSPSPYLNDPTLGLLGAKQDIVSDFGKSKIPEQGVSQSVTRIDNMAGSGTKKLLVKKDDEISESGLLRGSSLERLKKGLTSSFSSFASTDPYSMVPEASLKPLFGRASQILKKLKMCLLDMEAALPEEALRSSKVHPEKRRAWHAFVKSSETIFEMVQATIVLEDMIKADYLKTGRWYWSSISAAAKTSTLSSLALRICALDNAIVYTTSSDLTSASSLKPGADVDEQSPSNIDSSEKSKQTRRTSSRKKRDAES